MTIAKVVTVTQLAHAIDKAALLAAERHGVVLDKENIIHKWDLVGRMIREGGSIKGGGVLEVAETLVKEAGLQGTPIAAKIGKDILVGVVARELNVNIFR